MEIVPDTYIDLFWGYSVIWLCIVIYLFSIFRRLRRVEKELEDLKSE